MLVGEPWLTTWLTVTTMMTVKSTRLTSRLEKVGVCLLPFILDKIIVKTRLDITERGTSLVKFLIN